MKKLLRHIVILFFSLPLWGGLGWGLFSSCAPSLPSDVIPEDDMADILYDYHLATSLAQHDNSLKVENMYADILKKHGITQAEFDSSMVYYTRHYSLLGNIYGRVEERMMKQTLALGGNVQDINSMGEGFSSADTTNIWNGEASLLLLQYAPHHVRQFEIKPDTTYREGDKFLLSFDTEFLVQEGSYAVVAMLATRLKNDSVVFSTQNLSYSGHGSLTVNDTERKGIKSISGFFTFKTDATDSRLSAKLGLVRNIKLIRMHTEDPNKPTEEKQEQDNGIQETSLDSAGRATADTVGREGVVLSEKGLPDSE